MTHQSKTLRALRSITQSTDWDAIYTTELPRVYNFFLYKVADRELTQDLTATTFERAWKLRGRYDAALASPATWLFGIARNVLREYLRKNKKAERRLAAISQSDENLLDSDVEQGIQKQQDKERLRRIILELPAREQELIALKYGAGLTNRRIAEVTKLSESNVGSILHRTVKSLRKRWDENHG